MNAQNGKSLEFFATNPVFSHGDFLAVLAYHAALQFHGRSYSLGRKYHFLTKSRTRPFTFQGQNFVPVQAPLKLRALPDFGGCVLEIRHGGSLARGTNLERPLVGG